MDRQIEDNGAPSLSPIAQKPYRPMSFRGIVLLSFTREASKEISCIIYSEYPRDEGRTRLYLVPRTLYNEMAQTESKEDKMASKSRINKLRQELNWEDQVLFTAKEHIVTWVERDFKNAKKTLDIGSLIKSHDTSTIFNIAIQIPGVFSHEHPRPRFHHRGALPPMQIRDPIIRNCIPNVPYICLFELTINMRGFENRPLTRSNPWNPNDPKSHGYKFIQVVNVYRPWVIQGPVQGSSCYAFPSPDELREVEDLIQLAPWNRIRPPARHNPFYAQVVTANSDYNKDVTSECIILNKMEAFCIDRPNSKCLIGHIVNGDFEFYPGRVIGCQLYWCTYNNAFIIYRYQPDPAVDRGNRRRFSLKLDYSSENPMQTRHCDGHVDFLGFVKLNRIGHFYSTFAIPMIADPKQIMHGRFKLGDENASWEHWTNPGVGVKAWLRYNPHKFNIKWEVVELAANKKIKHEKFTSAGFRLNRRGFVYCPNVCNFPLVLKSDLLNECNVGDWIQFEALYMESDGQYEIGKILDNKKRKYDLVELAGEADNWAFRIPLNSNYHCTRDMLLNNDVGFVEDNDRKFTLFLNSWQQKHNGPAFFWCCENSNLEKRLTPLRVIGIKKPSGIDG